MHSCQDLFIGAWPPVLDNAPGIFAAHEITRVVLCVPERDCPLPAQNQLPPDCWAMRFVVNDVISFSPSRFRVPLSTLVSV